jgi:hypothetical protein
MIFRPNSPVLRIDHAGLTARIGDHLDRLRMAHRRLVEEFRVDEKLRNFDDD